MTAPTAPDGPTLTYVYAVTPPAPGLGESLGGLAGVADSPVALLVPTAGGTAAPVAFVVSDVPRAEWAEEVLRERFEDLRWLEDTARAHHRVIEALAARTTVLPLRLATLYADRTRALQALEEQGQDFAGQLARLSAHTEYGVKVYVRPSPPAGTTAPAGPATPEPAAGPAQAGAGRAYLRARRAQHEAREGHYRQAQLAADRIAGIALRCAAQQVRHSPQAGPLAAGADGENVLNDAFLVPDDRAEAFRAAVRGAAEDLPGIRLEVTGPWAPYSFAAAPPTPPAP
ncbi:GvpL/GvpF family gas vesicle protein [Streptomyces sp. NPDC101206]|uniref:GvpL/GvpF family gas vesicle protein n=1 Tax=Streptomyces sp. NPDC101206 TaxID=3366128 RepID=UPI0037F63F5D